MDVVTVSLDKIRIADRLRAVDPDWVAALARSMAVNGLQHPVEIAKPDRKGQAELIAGAHRIEAARSLGWTEIAAIVFTGGKLQRRLREIDENLYRRELSALDRAAHLAERKRIYETLFPQTRKGAQGGRGGLRNETDKLSFSKSTAEKLGLSEKSIERAVRRYGLIAPAVRARIAGTWLAEKGVELDTLTRLGPERQMKAVALVLDGKAPTIAAADRILEGVREPAGSPTEAAFQKLLTAWRRADQAARQAFLAHLRETGQLPAGAPEKDAA